MAANAARKCQDILRKTADGTASTEPSSPHHRVSVGLHEEIEDTEDHRNPQNNGGTISNISVASDSEISQDTSDEYNVQSKDGNHSWERRKKKSTSWNMSVSLLSP